MVREGCQGWGLGHRLREGVGLLGEVAGGLVEASAAGIGAVGLITPLQGDRWGWTCHQEHSASDW